MLKSKLTSDFKGTVIVLISTFSKIIILCIVQVSSMKAQGFQVYYGGKLQELNSSSSLRQDDLFTSRRHIYLSKSCREGCCGFSIIGCPDLMIE